MNQIEAAHLLSDVAKVVIAALKSDKQEISLHAARKEYGYGNVNEWIRRKMVKKTKNFHTNRYTLIVAELEAAKVVSLKPIYCIENK